MVIQVNYQSLSSKISRYWDESTGTMYGVVSREPRIVLCLIKINTENEVLVYDYMFNRKSILAKIRWKQWQVPGCVLYGSEFDRLSLQLARSQQ